MIESFRSIGKIKNTIPKPEKTPEMPKCNPPKTGSVTYKPYTNTTSIDEIIDKCHKLNKTLNNKVLNTVLQEAYNDAVNCPSHYTDGKIEVIDYIEDKKLGFCLGNVIKYVSRAGKKHSNGMSDKEKTIQDLKKARWYLNREIKNLEGCLNDKN